MRQEKHPIKWIYDFSTDFDGHKHALKRALHYEISDFQMIEVVETLDFGLCFVLDGEVQSFERDEFIYHEAMIHPAMLLHPEPKHVAIIGGGEGASLREALKHGSVESIAQIDIDERVIATAKEYLHCMHQGSFDDPRAHIHLGDGRKFLENSPQCFDVIVTDLTNPWVDSPSYSLFTREFYTLVMDRLSPQGILVVQAGNTSINCVEQFAIIHRTISAVFKRVYPYAAFVTSFAADWGFVLASKELDLLDLTPHEVEARIESRISGSLSFYDGITHQRIFALPKHLREVLEHQTHVNQDSDPLRQRMPATGN